MRIYETLAFVGLCVVVFLAYIMIKGIFKFVQRVVVGKYKIKCICKHEYVPYIKLYCGEHGINYSFRCRKCDKEKEIKTYQDAKKDSVF